MTNKEVLRQRQDALLAVYESVRQTLMQMPGVLGVGVGLKEVQGQLTDQICFRVYVEEKKDAATLPAEQLIPATIEGFPTDVLKILTVREQADFVERRDLAQHRPLRGGAAISTKTMSKDYKAGTLGWFARKKSDNSRVILSNCHVLFTDIVTDDPVVRTDTDKMTQPFYDKTCCCEYNVIGQTIIGIKNPSVDCAIGHFDDDLQTELYISHPLTTHKLRVNDTDTAIVGETVRKIGMRSAFTQGIVADIGAAVAGTMISLPDGRTTKVRVNQIIIWPDNTETYIDDHFGAIAFSNEGDSGSVILDTENKIVGLLFASFPEAPPRRSLCIANHIGTVLQQLKDNGHEIILEKSPPGGGDPPVLALRSAIKRRDLLAECPEPLAELVRRHRPEISALIEHRRPVLVVWRRLQGPAFANAVVRNQRDAQQEIPLVINGVPREELLARMGVALEENGSEALRRDLRMYGLLLATAFMQGKSVRAIMTAVEEAFLAHQTQGHAHTTS